MDAAVTAVSFKVDEEQVVAGSASGGIRLFDLATPKVSRGLVAHEDAVRCVQLCRHGIVSGSDDQVVKVWDMRSAEAGQMTFRGHSGAVVKATFSPNGKWVVSADDRGQVKVRPGLSHIADGGMEGWQHIDVCASTRTERT